MLIDVYSVENVTILVELIQIVIDIPDDKNVLYEK